MCTGEWGALRPPAMLLLVAGCIPAALSMAFPSAGWLTPHHASDAVQLGGTRACRHGGGLPVGAPVRPVGRGGADQASRSCSACVCAQLDGHSDSITAPHVRLLPHLCVAAGSSARSTPARMVSCLSFARPMLPGPCLAPHSRPLRCVAACACVFVSPVCRRPAFARDG